MSGYFLSCSKAVKDPWKFQRLGVISLEMPQRKWASCRLEWRGSWIFPSFSRYSRVTMGIQGPALVASGKASPLASCSGAFRGPLGFPLPSMPGPKILCGVGAGT